jgi:hypothetical protein
VRDARAAVRPRFGLEHEAREQRSETGDEQRFLGVGSLPVTATAVGFSRAPRGDQYASRMSTTKTSVSVPEIVPSELPVAP